MTDSLTLAFCIGLPLFHAAIALLIPSLYARSIPFGVRVPQTRVNDPGVASAKSIYRRQVLIILAIAVIAGVLLSLPLGEATIFVVSVLSVLIIIWPHVVAHNHIESIKNREDWYGGVETRIAASITAEPDDLPEDPGDATVKIIPTWAWYAASFVFPIVGAWKTWQIYPEIPDPMPVHWNASGVADNFSDKSLWGVLLQTVGVTTGLIIFILIMVIIVQKIGVKQHSWKLGRAGGLTTQQELERHIVVQQSAIDALGLFTFGMAGSIQWLMLRSVDPSVHKSGWDFGAILVAILVLTVAIIAWPVWKGKHFDKHAGIGPDGTEVPDDTQHWVGGLFYINGQDSAVLVPKRSGSGWTLNMGSPWGLVISVALLIMPLAVVAAQLM